MKPLLLSLLAIAGFVLAAVAVDGPAKKGPVRHIVAFKFKDTATKEQIAEVEQAFAALKTKIPLIVSLEWGTDVSTEKRNKGFTHAFLVTFKNEQDRDAYLVHPEHKKFGQLAGPVLGDVFVIDILAGK